MLKKIIESCVKNRFLVILFSLIVVGGGIYVLLRTPVDAIPDLSDVQVIIYSEWMGQSPKEIEDQVTYPLSTAMLSVPRVKVVRGYSYFGFSLIYIIFEDRTDLYWARSRVLEYMNYVLGKLPKGVNTTLGPDATGTGWVFQYTVEGKGQSLGELRALQDWYIRYQLNSVPGVAEVATAGGFVMQYQVNLDPDRLLAYNIPINKVMMAIRKSNQQVGASMMEFAGAEYMVRGLGYIADIKDIENVVVGNNPNGTPILLKDISYINRAPEMRRGVTERDGKGEVVTGIVIMRYGYNPLQVIENVKKKISEIKGGLPKGVEIIPIYDRSHLIHKAIDTLKEKLVEESIIVAIVCLVFLWHFRSALVAILVLPMGILISLIVMKLQGLNANIMSLGGIAIAIGVMIDGATVMIENAHKLIERNESMGLGKGRWEIMIEASKQVGPPLFFSLLIITVSFFPIFSLEAQEGRLFKPLAFTKTYAVAAAALLSITLVPILMGLFIRGKIVSEQKNPLNRFMIRIYRPLINMVLKYRFLTLFFAFLFLILTIYPLKRIGSEFMPTLNEGDIFYMPITLPGISITQASSLLQIQDKILKTLPEAETVLGKVGRANTATDPSGLDMAETIVILKPMEKWRKGMTMDDLVKELDSRMKIPGVTNAWTMPIKNRIDMLATGIRTPVGIKVFGPDLEIINRISTEIEGVIREVPGTASVYAVRLLDANYVDFDIKREEAARYGLTVADVQDVITSALGGMSVTMTVEGRRRFPVAIRYSRELRDDIESIKRVMVPVPIGGMAGGTSEGVMGKEISMSKAPEGRGLIKKVAASMGSMERSDSSMEEGSSIRIAPLSPGMGRKPMSSGMGPGGGAMSGRSPIGMGGNADLTPRLGERTRLVQVPLGQLADIRIKKGPMGITSENALVTGTVFVDIRGTDIGGYVTEAKKMVSERVKLPPGYYLTWSGQYEYMLRAQARMKMIIPLTLLIVFLLLYFNFKSVAESLIVMLSLPFAITGGVWIMYLLNFNMSIATGVGFIALAGVAAETGVVMLIFLDEAYHKRMSEGSLLTFKDLKEAIVEGAVLRVRPKMMTVTAIIGGLLPIMWGKGTGSEVMKRIAAPMVGGMVSATILTLLIIPVIYAFWKGWELKNKRNKE